MRIAVATATMIALAGIAAPSAGAQPAGPMQMMHPPIDGTMLTIVAEGSSTQVPDIANIEAGVVTQAASAADAMRQNSQQMSRVIAALRAAGIAERDLQSSNISLSPVYRRADEQAPTITGYQASNQLSVRFRDIAKAGSILDILVREGANSISGPNLTLDKPEVARDAARSDAIAAAKARAQLYAKAAGLRVDRMVSIEEGGSSPGPVYAMARRETMDAGTQVLPGEQEVTISVTVRFLLK